MKKRKSIYIPSLRIFIYLLAYFFLYVFGSLVILLDFDNCDFSRCPVMNWYIGIGYLIPVFAYITDILERIKKSK